MKHINFSNLPKCDEDWAKMPEIEGGRLCQKCDVKMIDFTGMSNLEIIKLHAESEGRVCGHYLPSQLAFPLQEKETLDTPSFLTKVIIGLSTITTTLFINPAASIAQVPIEIVDQKDKKSPKESTNERIGQVRDFVVLKGRIVDDSAEPLPFASVYVKETTWGVSADLDGFFTLILNRDVCQKDTFTLVYFYLGFTPVEQKIACTTIEDEEVWLGEQVLNAEMEVVVVGPGKPIVNRYYAMSKTFEQKKKKWWQKGFFRRIFRKKK